MIAPSSPVPAVERIELPGGWYFQQCNPPHGVIYALRTPKGQGFGINGTGMSVGLPVVQAFAAAMSTPTPGRAAEPDTMGEVERLISNHAADERRWSRRLIQYCDDKHPSVKEAQAQSDAAKFELNAAVRTIATERDEARTRAETTEAQIATLRARIEQDLVAIERQVKITCDFDRNETADKKADPVATTVEISLSHVTDAVARIRNLLSTSGADR